LKIRAFTSSGINILQSYAWVLKGVYPGGVSSARIIACLYNSQMVISQNYIASSGFGMNRLVGTTKEGK
jgi:hypothetical protein